MSGEKRNPRFHQDEEKVGVTARTGADVEILDPNAFQERVSKALIENKQGEIILDFDETLFLRNSTMEYLRCGRPRVLARIICKVVDLVRPWRLSKCPDRKHVYRDWLRVLAVTLLMPWTLPLWTFVFAPQLGRNFMNQPLVAAISNSNHRDVRVVTFGFRAVVAPLLAATGLPFRLYAAPLIFGYRVRSLGKLKYLEREIGLKQVAGSICVTDSKEDSDLLGACKTPLLIKSAAAHPRPIR